MGKAAAFPVKIGALSAGKFLHITRVGQPGSGVDAASVDTARRVKNGNLYQ